jgi:hypothetical protein
VHPFTSIKADAFALIEDFLSFSHPEKIKNSASGTNKNIFVLKRF